MNHLIIGTAEKTSRLLDLAGTSFLLIDDGPIAGKFLKHFPDARLFDIAEHSFNPLSGIDYKRARDFAAAIYTASPEGKDTLTVRNGRRALAKMLLDAKRLDNLITNNEEVTATIDDLLLSPVLKRVLCNKTNFWFRNRVVLKLDRAKIGDFDAFVLASLLTGQSRGQIIIPDFGFYGRDFHISLIRQNRLTAGINFLRELSPKLQNAVLLVDDKKAEHCTYDDASTLALYAGLRPGDTGHSDFVRDAMA